MPDDKKPPDPRDIKYPQSVPYDPVPPIAPKTQTTKSRLEVMQDLHKMGKISDKTMREAAFGPSPFIPTKSVAEEALRKQAELMEQQMKLGAKGTLGTVGTGEPADEELDMAPGSMARRIVNTAARQAKFEMAKEDTLLGEMCELLHQRLKDLEQHAELMLQQQRTLVEENQRLRAQNLRLTDLVLDKLGVKDEGVRTYEETTEAGDDGTGEEAEALEEAGGNNAED